MYKQTNNLNLKIKNNFFANEWKKIEQKASKPKKKPPTTSSDGHESRRWREGAAAPRDAASALSASGSVVKRCGQKVDVSLTDLSSNLRKQVPRLIKSSGARRVEFKVVIKKGKAVLKAIPRS